MLITAIVFSIILSILVFVHEFGHYLVARWVGVQVEEFGFGLPPRIWGKKVGGTIYSVNWLPIGGFVKLAGEDEEESQKSKVKSQNIKKYFWARSKKERSAILLAGVTMNFLLAVGITAYLLHQGILEPAGRVHIEKVMTATPAQRAGFLPGDIVKYVEHAPSPASGTTSRAKITSSAAFMSYVNEEKGQEIIVHIVRSGKELAISVIPRVNVPKGEGPLGVAISDLEPKIYPWNEAPIEAVKINLSRAWLMLTSLAGLVWGLIRLRPVPADVAGPIGIAQVTGQAVKYGLTAVLEFVSILSLNLAVLNVLPFPALDGGRLVFVFLEKILGRKVRPVFERRTHEIGMIILLVLILLISLHDILRLTGGGLGGG